MSSENSKTAVSGASKLKQYSISSNLSATPDRDYLISSVKRFEEEKSCMEYEINRLTTLLKRTSEKEARWKNSFQEANSEAIRLHEVAREANSERARLKVDSIIRENELRKVLSENEELRKREMALLVKVDVLTNSLDEKNGNYDNRQEVEFEECEKDYDVIPKWSTSFVRVSVDEDEKEDDKNEEYDDSEVDFEMWESFEIDEYALENDDEVEDGEDKKKRKKKKKKALLGKIGSLLKKGNGDHN